MDEHVDGRTLAGSKHPHDEQGHFTHADSEQSKSSPAPKDNPLTNFLHNQTTVSKTTDNNTLIDIHVGNPLRRIAQLLEDIRKQKAFTFDIKGSLGVAGILIVITTFGIFGGTKALCSKGEQSHIGSLQKLTIIDSDNRILLPRLINMWNRLSGSNPNPARISSSRIVLIKSDQTVFRLKSTFDLSNLLNTNVIATGDVDTCSQTINVKSPTAIQQYPQPIVP